MWFASPWDLYKGMFFERVSQLFRTEKATRVRHFDTSNLCLLFPLDRLHEIKEGVKEGTVNINGATFHAEAVEVVTLGDTQCGATEAAADLLDELTHLTNPPLETVRHNGKEYVLHIFPAEQ